MIRYLPFNGLRLDFFTTWNIAQLLKWNYFTNAARSRITTNLEQEVRDYACTFMYPDENTLTESIAASCSTGDSESSTSGDEELEDSEDKDESQ